MSSARRSIAREKKRIEFVSFDRMIKLNLACASFRYLSSPSREGGREGGRESGKMRARNKMGERERERDGMSGLRATAERERERGSLPHAISR